MILQHTTDSRVVPSLIKPKGGLGMSKRLDIAFPYHATVFRLSLINWLAFIPWAAEGREAWTLRRTNK